LSSQQLAFQGEGKVTVFGKEKEILALAEKSEENLYERWRRCVALESNEGLSELTGHLNTEKGSQPLGNTNSCDPTSPCLPDTSVPLSPTYLMRISSLIWNGEESKETFPLDYEDLQPKTSLSRLLNFQAGENEHQQYQLRQKEPSQKLFVQAGFADHLCLPPIEDAPSASPLDSPTSSEEPSAGEQFSTPSHPLSGIPSPQLMWSSAHTDLIPVSVHAICPLDVGQKKQKNTQESVSEEGNGAEQSPEQILVKATKGVIEDPTFNPYQGSLPSQKVQVKVQQQYPNEYEQVIGLKRGMAGWKEFLTHHADMFTLFLDGGRYRIRLTSNASWKVADYRAYQAHDNQERHYVQCLLEYLTALITNALPFSAGTTTPAASSASVSVDEFIEAYENGEAFAAWREQYPRLPKRGDFVKLIRKHSEFFAFDDKTHRIGLAKEDNSQSRAQPALLGGMIQRKAQETQTNKSNKKGSSKNAGYGGATPPQRGQQFTPFPMPVPLSVLPQAYVLPGKLTGANVAVAPMGRVFAYPTPLVLPPLPPLPPLLMQLQQSLYNPALLVPNFGTVQFSQRHFQ
jgi:hypothetical protein